MKKLTMYLLICCCVLGLAIAGCAQRPESANASEAISKAKTMESVEQQAQYLVKEANAFINSDQFEEAVKAAKYVLSKLDSSSTEAKSIIEKAQAEIKKLAEEKLQEVKDAAAEKLGSFGQ